MTGQADPATPGDGELAWPPADHPLDVLRLDRQLCFLLYSTVNRMTRLYRPVLGEMGLTFPQYLTLLALWEKSPRTVGSLCEALDLDSGTLTPLLKRLERQGLVRRHRDPADERRVMVELTEKARALSVQAAQVPAQMLCKITLPLTDLMELYDRIQKLNAHLGDVQT